MSKKRDKLLENLSPDGQIDFFRRENELKKRARRETREAIVVSIVTSILTIVFITIVKIFL